MELNRETFKVIGRCNKMQTVSWDQETKLWDGIPYDINFFQDFSSLYLDKVQVSKISASAMIEAIVSEGIPDCSSARRPSGEDYRRGQELWASVDRTEKEERKREKKWGKKHPKPKIKEAERNFSCIVDELMRG